MVSPRLILARHGQTEANRDGLIMGRSDSPLTPAGVESARALAAALVQEKVAAIFASSLGRTVASANIYAARLKADVIATDSIVELACGEWEGKPRDPSVGADGPLRKTWEHRPPGGESYRDAELRVAALIHEIVSLGNGATIMVVAHAGVNRVFLKLWLDLTTDEALAILSPHDVAYILDPEVGVVRRSGAGVELKGFLSLTA